MGKKSEIKAVIFDLGGVLINLDWTISYRCFEKYTKTNEIDWDKFEENLYSAERGQISAQQFRENLRQILKNPHLTDEQIDNCWNSMILDWPDVRKDIVRQVRQKYPVYLLSNIMHPHYHHVISQPYWQPELFDRIFWSCRLGYRKPEPQIYLTVLQQIGLQPEQVFFLDDKEQNVEAARKLGINTVHVSKPLEDLWPEISKEIF